MTNLDCLTRNGELKREMKAAVYARANASPDLAEYETLEKQVDAGREFGKKCGYSVPKEFIFAEQASGKDSKRDRLLSLIDLVKRRGVDAVIVKDISRLSRDVPMLLFVAQTCEENGVKILIAGPSRNELAFSYEAARTNAAVLSKIIREIQHMTDADGQEGRK